MVKFKITGEKPVTSQFGNHFRVACEDIKTKETFYVKSATSVAAYHGGTCEKVLKAGETVEINGEQIKLNRATGVDAMFNSINRVREAKEYVSLMEV